MLRLISRVVVLQNSFLRNFQTSAISRLREIKVEEKDEKTTVISCKYVKSPREPYLFKVDTKNNKCPLCRLQLNLKYTDVLILCQYVDSKGNIFERRNTNLCKEQYKLVKELIYMAQAAGLLPEPPREEPKKPYMLLNTYYDETTINLRPKPFKRDPRFYYLSKKLSPMERFRVKPEKGHYFGSQMQ